MSRPIPEGVEAPDKDALIRELRESLAWAASCQAATLATLPKSTSKRDRERHARICTKLAGLLRGESVERRGFHPFDLEQTVQAAIDRCENAARTTCPEAFDGCYETSADGR